jgi:hypothetical protein
VFLNVCPVIVVRQVVHCTRLRECLFPLDVKYVCTSKVGQVR